MVTIDSGVIVALGGFALLGWMFWLDSRKDPPSNNPSSSHYWDYKTETEPEDPTNG